MPLLFGVFALSAAAIGYEILLTRLLSIVLWHHFAFMIISVALLGVGASGTFLAFAWRWLEPRFALAFAGFSTAFGIAAPGCFALAQRVPFNPLEVIWDLGQQVYLLQVYLLLALPFFFSATAIGLALVRFRDRIAVIYRADLTGAGGGALLVVCGLFLIPEENALAAICGIGILAGALGACHDPRNRRPAVGLAILALAAPFLWPASWTTPRPSPYKGLSLALHRPGAQVLSERSGPLGRLTVVDSPTIPFRHAPGLSLKATGEPPPQLGVFTDGDSFTAITRFDGDMTRFAYLDQQTAALPFHLLERPRTLILGAGGGADVLRALYHRAAGIDAVEIDPRVVELVRGDFGEFAGHLYDLDDVAVHVSEARRFVEASERRWDLIQVALLDAFSTAAAGVLALRESTLYTVEAFESYLSRLEPGGMLAITRWTKVPPRDSLKLFATAAAALERRGATAPGERLALIRSWSTATLLVKNGAFTPAESEAIRAFSTARAFDVAYFPGMTRDEANRYNRLRTPQFYDGAKALLGPERDRFLADYKFFIEPATDDRPYFFRFFKWRILPEVLGMRGKSGIVLLEGGYLILAATLVQAAVASAILILLPLAWLKRPPEKPPAALGRGRVVLYFLALGLAFLFIEIAFIQRFVLFLGHPLYAIAVVLAAFLVFAGLGSGYSARLPAEAAAAGSAAEDWRVRIRRPIPLAVLGIAAIAAAYLLLLPALFGSAMALPPVLKVGLSILLIAPLAFCMGMPFPLGLRRVAGEAPELVPWAWGVNGCGSVLSAVLASLTATHFGFTVVIILAIGLYVAAAYVFKS